MIEAPLLGPIDREWPRTRIKMGDYVPNLKSAFIIKLLQRRLLKSQATYRRLWQIFLLFWLLTFIYLTYRLTGISDVGRLPNEMRPNLAELPQNNEQRQHFEPVSQSSLIPETSNDIEPEKANSPIEETSVINDIKRPSMVSNLTKEWDLLSYVRQTKVFILIIENEERTFHTYPPTRSTSSQSRKRRLTPDLESDMPNPDWNFNIPIHISIVIDILESHRIGYTLGSTRNGLPSSLLSDTSDNAAKKLLYSVIIMDDFIKYTKLSRWLRDQLDRHCRKNKVGVVSYIMDSPETAQMSSSTTTTTTLNRSSSIPPSSSLPTSTRYQTNSGTQFRLDNSGGIDSLADQFPLSFRPIHQNSCRNISSSSKDKRTRRTGNDIDYHNGNRRQRSVTTKWPSRSGQSCLRDFQLNDKSGLLRILKRKPNFILPGPLIRNVNRSPWMSISSNHITYEPLTWATLMATPASLPMEPNTRLSNQTGGASHTKMASQQLPTKDFSPTLRHRRRVNINRIDTNDDKLQARLVALNDSSSSSSRASSLIHQMDGNIATNGSLSNRSQQNDGSSWDDSMASADLLEDPEPDSMGNLGNDEAEKDEPEQANYLGPVDDQSNGSQDQQHSLGGDDSLDRQVLSVYDRGLYDGIKRVIFGGGNHHWVHRILLLDSIEHLSEGKILSPLDRYVQIDIDDIFVGEKGTKMCPGDVDALVASQQDLASRISGNFRFNLGYSGRFFELGLEPEKEGDRRLVEKANHFTWFCHTWSHSKAHLANSSASIELELSKNLDFARTHKLPIISQPDSSEQQPGPDQRPKAYAVAPHHSGVYPIHEFLYQAWQRLLNVQVTSTEEYPHLRPASARRAFVHQAIKVLPRQTCGLYTHTIYKARYPGGLGRLINSIQGGELFNTLLHNPINIYMTHQSNYARDRLAPFTFRRLVDFVQRYTNLQLRYQAGNEQNAPAVLLANYYFSLFPTEQREPLWTNPCSDQRHLAIWSSSKHSLCQVTPKLLIVGPQKSGTMALLEFLKLSPNIRSSVPSSEDFEELQFFNRNHYWRGVDWYLARFVANQSSELPYSSRASLWSVSSSQQEVEELAPTTMGTLATSGLNYSSDLQPDQELGQIIYVDKSATYFDDPEVPQRAQALLPDARVVIILINPADRAYSWYQHQRAHSDLAALNYTFEQVLTASDSELKGDPSLGHLRDRILTPGLYSSHLNRWLDFYPSRQIIIIDGQWFRLNPSAVLNKLQMLLRLPVQLDFRHLLEFNPKKGFFCVKQAPEKKWPRKHPTSGCLGPGKGRRYAPMSADARLFLNRFYYAHNRKLARILNEIGQAPPAWLLEAISGSVATS